MPGVQPDIGERLQVDVDRARRVATGAERFAARAEEASLERASSHLLAGSCWSLVDVDHAARAFAAAADDYARLRRSYGAVARICAVSRGPGLQDEAEEERVEGLSADDGLHLLLLAHWATAIGADGEEESRELFWRLTEDAALTSTPVGRIGITLRSYLAVASSFATAAGLAALGAVPERRAAAIADGLVDVLERAQEPYAMAMADRYHWSRLHSGLLPVEPELLAVSVLASATARQLELPRLTRVVGRELSPVAEAFLLLGELFVLERWDD